MVVERLFVDAGGLRDCIDACTRKPKLRKLPQRGIEDGAARILGAFLLSTQAARGRLVGLSHG